MIGELPKTLNVKGKEYKIRSDYRACLDIMAAMEDPELDNAEKQYVMLYILYEEQPENLYSDVETLKDACDKAVWFLDAGKKTSPTNKPKVVSWTKDEQYIFAAVNKVAPISVRSCEYLHWWDFIGYFMEIGESVFSTIVTIRMKNARGEKLTDQEKKYQKENQEAIYLPDKTTEDLLAFLEEQERCGDNG